MWNAGNKVNEDGTLRIKTSGLKLHANFHVVTRDELQGASGEHTFGSSAEAQNENEFSNISTHIFSNLHFSASMYDESEDYLHDWTNVWVWHGNQFNEKIDDNTFSASLDEYTIGDVLFTEDNQFAGFDLVRIKEGELTEADVLNFSPLE